MSPWNITYLEEQIAQECRRIRRRFTGLTTLPASHDLYRQEQQHLEQYCSLLALMVGSKQADMMIYDLYAQANIKSKTQSRGR